jgi:glycosyltransferase involved in cell wall biosynthesis
MGQARRVLFISPVMPGNTGHGIAMRAGMCLDALARAHEVALLVVPVAGPADPEAVPRWVTQRASTVVVLPPDIRSDTHYALIARVVDSDERARALAQYPRPVMARFATPSNVADAAGRVGDMAFDVVHVCRLYMAPFAAPFLAGRSGKRPLAVLDLDDDEPRTHRRVADLYGRRGRAAAAAFEAGEAAKYERLEREWLPGFDRVLVCSDLDAAALADRVAPDRVAVVPNAVRAPSAGSEGMSRAIPETTPGADTRRARGGGRNGRAAGQERDRVGVLFVGSYAYFPNEDAALFFAEEVWPPIVAAAPCPVEARLVGSRPGAAVRALRRLPGIVVTGEVPSVAPYYAEADIAVNPIRAGGGTRVKAIEAFAHRVPLVSTSIGVEGLDVEHDRHLLIADTADAFAQACLALMREPGRGRLLAGAAHRRYRERYSMPAATRRLRAVYRALR